MAASAPGADLTRCRSCGEPRGNRTREWVPILRDGTLTGYTCPACPAAGEPIRRIASKAGVRFRAVLDATPRRSQSRRQVTKTLATLDEARAYVAEVRAEVDRSGEFRQPTEQPSQIATETLASLCTRWLDSRVDVREITREGYAGALAPVLRHLGDREHASLTPADVRDLVAWLSRSGGRASEAYPEGRPLAPRSVRAALVALGQVLDLGIADELLSRNVARGAKRPRQTKRVGRDLEHWQPAELLAFRRHSDTDPLAAAWRLSLAGLTRADVMGLRWLDVDLDAGTVSITQGRVQLQRDGQRAVVDEPKSKQRCRTVSVEEAHPGTVQLLKTLRRQQLTDKLAAGAAYHDTGYVVVDALGVPVRPEWYSDAFRRLCSAAGVRVIKLHSVRHSLAFWLHSLGVTPADAAALLGHKVEVHLSTYLPGSGTSGIATATAALGKASAAV